MSKKTSVRIFAGMMGYVLLPVIIMVALAYTMAAKERREADRETRTQVLNWEQGNHRSAEGRFSANQRLYLRIEGIEDARVTATVEAVRDTGLVMATTTCFIANMHGLSGYQTVGASRGDDLFVEPPALNGLPTQWDVRLVVTVAPTMFADGGGMPFANTTNANTYTWSLTR